MTLNHSDCLGEENYSINQSVNSGKNSKKNVLNNLNDNQENIQYEKDNIELNKKEQGK